MPLRIVDSLDLLALAAPATPATGRGKIWFDSTSKHLKSIDDAGVVIDMGAAGSTPTQVARSAVSASGDYVAEAKIAADTTYRAFLGLTTGDVGSLELGPGGVAARDVRLERTGAGTIKLSSISAAAPSQITIEATSAQASEVALQVAGDAFPRAFLRGDAGWTGFRFGSGAAAGDIGYTRTNTGTVKMDAAGTANPTNIVVESTSGQANAFLIDVSGDFTYRIKLQGDATQTAIELGSGAAARDLRIYRSGAKTMTLDDTAGGAITSNFVGTLQQGGVSVSVIGHGAADHADVSRSMFLDAADSRTDGGTAGTIGTTPDITPTVNLADAAAQGTLWGFQIPSDWPTGGTLSIQPIWAPALSDLTAHTVRWVSVAKIVSSGSTVTAAGTTNTWTGASGTRSIGVVVYDTNVSTGLAPNPGDLVRIRLGRLGADALDTLTVTVALIGILITYTATQ